MSGDIMANVDLSAIVTALNGAVTGSDIVTLMATGIAVALPLILTWFAVKFIYRKFVMAVIGGRG